MKMVWKSKEVVLADQDGLRVWRRSSLCRRGLCVHRMISIERRDQWRISHIRTGFAFPVYMDTERKATAAADELIALPMDWTRGYRAVMEWQAKNVKWWADFKRRWSA